MTALEQYNAYATIARKVGRYLRIWTQVFVPHVAVLYFGKWWENMCHPLAAIPTSSSFRRVSL